jgi:4-hydroxybenzoate polyprenyltransferase
VAIGLGLLIGRLYFGEVIFVMYLLFILVNIVYTHIAKRIPYIEIICNSFTYPMRFVLGILLVAPQVPYFLITSIFFFAIGMACVRRIVEKRAPGW